MITSRYRLEFKIAVGRSYTPENINSLKPNEVFVFGSNLAGHHDGGAARAAVKKFGAIMGQGVGLQGQSYAIPTARQDGRAWPYPKSTCRENGMFPTIHIKSFERDRKLVNRDYLNNRVIT